MNSIREAYQTICCCNPPAANKKIDYLCYDYTLAIIDTARQSIHDKEDNFQCKVLAARVACAIVPLLALIELFAMIVTAPFIYYANTKIGCNQIPQAPGGPPAPPPPPSPTITTTPPAGERKNLLAAINSRSNSPLAGLKTPPKSDSPKSGGSPKTLLNPAALAALQANLATRRVAVGDD